VLLLAGGSCGDSPREPLRPPPLVIRARLPQPAEVAQRVVTPLPEDGRARAKRVEGERDTQNSARFPLQGVAFHVLAQVHAKPDAGAAVTGYMRRGSRFAAGNAVRGKGCRGGRWHAVQGGGFICSGRGFVVGPGPQHFEPAPAPPSLQAELPYPYMKTVGRNELQYWRVPSEGDIAAGAEGLRALRARAAAAPAEPLTETGANSEAGAATVGDAEPGESEEPPRLLPDFVRMAMEPGFYVSIDAAASTPDSEYLRTVRGAYVRAAAMEPAGMPAMRGKALDGKRSLPLGFVFLERARSYRRDAATGAIVRGDAAPKYTTVQLTEQRARDERRSYVVDREGELLSAGAVRVARATRRPPQVPKRARWVHVRLSEQVLVAYEGDRPVYATLVSTGKEGFATEPGLFRIHAKHVSTTMDGAEGTDEAYSIEDVPWTMYFNGSIALHAAFWHDRFGRVRSHGCVNLSPPDAHWLFQWSTPALPAGLHGVTPRLSDPSTYVLVEP